MSLGFLRGNRIQSLMNLYVYGEVMLEANYTKDNDKR